MAATKECPLDAYYNADDPEVFPSITIKERTNTIQSAISVFTIGPEVREVQETVDPDAGGERDVSNGGGCGFYTETRDMIHYFFSTVELGTQVVCGMNDFTDTPSPSLPEGIQTAADLLAVSYQMSADEFISISIPTPRGSKMSEPKVASIKSPYNANIQPNGTQSGQSFLSWKGNSILKEKEWTTP